VLLRIAGLQVCSGGEAVGEQALATFVTALQAVQKLKTRHGIPIRIVGVQTERGVSVGEVVRVSQGLDIEDPAIVGFCYISGQGRDRQHLSVLTRDRGKESDAEAN